mgnify:CR=1 FL=1
MKRAMLLTVLLLTGLCPILFGEAATDIHVRSLLIDKVFIHSLGYAAFYCKP